MQCSTVQYSTVQYSTVQYSTALNDRGVLAGHIWEQSDWKRPKHLGQIELNGAVGKRIAVMIIESKETNVKV